MKMNIKYFNIQIKIKRQWIYKGKINTKKQKQHHAKSQDVVLKTRAPINSY